MYTVLRIESTGCVNVREDRNTGSPQSQGLGYRWMKEYPCLYKPRAPFQPPNTPKRLWFPFGGVGSVSQPADYSRPRPHHPSDNHPVAEISPEQWRAAPGQRRTETESVREGTKAVATAQPFLSLSFL